MLLGIPLFPDEIKQFPEWSIFPLFRNEGDVFAFQLGEDLCPMLVDGKCGIYESRPLICRAFPVGNMDGRGLVVLRDRCIKLFGTVESSLNYDSFGPSFDAARERERREKSWPEATAIFDLKSKAWVAL